MLEDVARHVVDDLGSNGVNAHLAESGVYNVGIRIVLGDRLGPALGQVGVPQPTRTEWLALLGHYKG